MQFFVHSNLNFLYKLFSGWVDDSIFTRRNPENDEEVWSNGGSTGSGHPGGAFTTGRQRARPQPPAPPVKPRSQVPQVGLENINKQQRT